MSYIFRPQSEGYLELYSGFPWCRVVWKSNEFQKCIFQVKKDMEFSSWVEKNNEIMNIILI